MSERDESLDLEELSTGDRPLVLPDELPILPLRDTVLFPNSFMPLAVARETAEQRERLMAQKRGSSALFFDMSN